MKKIFLPVLVFLVLLVQVTYANSKNTNNIVEKYKILANSGEIDAMFSLGIIYSTGDGVIQDYKEAFKWFFMAANKDDIISQYNLAILYKDGLGVEKNQQEAYRNFLKSANKGYKEAAYMVGLALEKGDGVDKNLHSYIILNFFYNTNMLNDF